MKDETRTRTVRDVPNAAWAQLKAYAAIKDVSIGDMLGKVIEFYVEKNGSE